MSLKVIKNKIRSVNKTHKVTKAMEAVSAVKMRKAQERALTARPYALSALTILSRVSDSVDAENHPLTQERNGTKTCILLVTSDKGLAGNLNNAVIKQVVQMIKNEHLEKESVCFVCIGNKGNEYFAKREYTVVRHYDNLGDEVASDEMREVTKTLTEMFMRGEIDRCVVAYTNFVSTFEQRSSIRQVLPIHVEDVRKIIMDIAPAKGKFADAEETGESRQTIYEIEPDADEVFTELLPFLLNIELYHTLLEAKASEHSARMVAMKNASDKAEEMSDELTLSFNKERQTLITREVSEIVGGMETMK